MGCVKYTPLFTEEFWEEFDKQQTNHKFSLTISSHNRRKWGGTMIRSILRWLARCNLIKLKVVERKYCPICLEEIYTSDTGYRAELGYCPGCKISVQKER